MLAHGAASPIWIDTDILAKMRKLSELHCAPLHAWYMEGAACWTSRRVDLGRTAPRAPARHSCTQLMAALFWIDNNLCICEQWSLIAKQQHLGKTTPNQRISDQAATRNLPAIWLRGGIFEARSSASSWISASIRLKPGAMLLACWSELKMMGPS